jgi:iron complex transport system substrate-binding protein
MGRVATMTALALLLITAGASNRPGAAQAAPVRVVSLVPALTEMVFAIGAGRRVMAVSSYDEVPEEVKSLPRVGALLDPDVERIIAMRADLVLLYGSQTDLMTQLRRSSIRYYEYRHGGLATVTKTMRDLGRLLDASPAADALAARIDARLAALRRRVATLAKPRVLLVFSRERGSLRNIYASGGRGFLHDMLEAAGGVNVFADISAESVQATSEMILVRKPDVILEIRATALASDDDPASLTPWQTLASVPAVRNGRVHVLPGRMFVVPGPQVADAAEAMFRVLQEQGAR